MASPRSSPDPDLEDLESGRGSRAEVTIKPAKVEMRKPIGKSASQEANDVLSSRLGFTSDTAANATRAGRRRKNKKNTKRVVKKRRTRK
jgi:hypothetical protein